MNKYIVLNLKNSLNDKNVFEYVDNIKNIKYDNLIICPSKKYIKYFKSNNYKLCTQDYYDDIKSDYVIINHHELEQTKKEVIDKIKKSINEKRKIILCIGNNKGDSLIDLKNEISSYHINSNIILAYEPYYMIGSNEDVDINEISRTIQYIKQNFNNIKVLYGGNVNEKEIENILNISDGVLLGRLSFNVYNITKILNNLIK